MAYQSEAALEQQFIEQLNKQEYSTVDIPDYDALVENFKVQFEAFNAPKLDTPITDKEWERIFNLMLGKSVFQSAKILRDKFVLEREDGTKVYLSFFDQDHTKNIFQVTHQTTVVGKYVNRYDVTILVNGLPLIQVELKRRGLTFEKQSIRSCVIRSTPITDYITSFSFSLSPTALIPNTLPTPTGT